MDDVSIISIPYSDISFHTLIVDDQTTSTQFDNLTHNQQLHICLLFVNHWVDGTIKKGEELRSAKKDYIQGLKQKPAKSPTIVFEINTLVDMNTKLANENRKQNLSSICSKSIEPSRSPLKSNKSDDSRKRKGSDCCNDLVKKKRDENNNNLVGITERRKSVLFNKPLLSTATIARRKTILIDPRIHTQKSNQQNAPAETFGSESIKTNRRASSSSNDETLKSGGLPLTSSPSNLTVTKEITGENKLKSKDYSSSPSHKRSSKGDSSYREAKPSSSSYRPASSSYRDKSYRPEYSSKRSSSSESSSSIPREHNSKKRRPSEDRHQSHSAKKSRSSKDKSKSEMKHHSRNASACCENSLKNYKIPKYGGNSKQPKSNIQNSRQSKSPSKVEINTLPSTSKEMPSTAPHKRSKKHKSSKTSLTSETHQQVINSQQKKISTYATTSESEKTQNNNDKNELPDVPELDDCIIPEMNSTMNTNCIKFNPLNRHTTVEKNAIGSDSDNWIIRNKHGKLRIIKEKKKYHRKSSDKKQLSATQINDEIATNEVATDEVSSNKVVANEVFTAEVAAIEKANNKIANNEVISNEVVNKPIFKREIQNNSSHEIEIQEDNNIQIDSSQQTEVSTSNFGGQKNDDEKDKLLKEQEKFISNLKQATQKYECNIKEREQQNFSHEKTLIEQQNMIKEREQIIKERDRMIEERDLMIREREQKIEVYETQIEMQQHKINVMTTELIRLNQRNISLAAILHDKSRYCKEHHREKPKPKKPRTIHQTISPPEIVQPQIVPKTHNLNEFQNSILHNALQQTLAGNSSYLTGNSTSQRVLQQYLDQGAVFQPSNNEQTVFYCLICRQPANLICENCRNCCACSQSCYELISAKHMSECILPNMVSISSLYNKINSNYFLK